MSTIFIDTNILIYANDSRDPNKQEKSIQLITELIKDQKATISVQVLQEYANTALKKLKQPTDIVIRQIKLLESIQIIIPTAQSVIRAIEIQSAYQTSFWDGAIIAAAEQGNCDCILSEDLNNGQFYAGIPINNPFH